MHIICADINAWIQEARENYFTSYVEFFLVRACVIKNAKKRKRNHEIPHMYDILYTHSGIILNGILH